MAQVIIVCVNNYIIYRSRVTFLISNVDGRRKLNISLVQQWTGYCIITLLKYNNVHLIKTYYTFMNRLYTFISHLCRCANCRVEKRLWWQREASKYSKHWRRHGGLVPPKGEQVLRDGGHHSSGQHGTSSHCNTNTFLYSEYVNLS